MHLPILLVLAVLVLVAVLAIARLRLGSGATGVPEYSRKRALFSPAERSFLGVLEQIAGDRYRIFGKVRVADVLEPRRGLNGSRRQAAWNRINAKHFDFVLCAPADLSIVCAIELDDASHLEATRQDRDVFLVAACRSASFPLVQVRAQRAYSIDEVKSALASVLQPRPVNS